MGITINFEGRLKNAKAFKELITRVKKFAQKEEWPFEEVSAEEARLLRTGDGQPEDYVGPVKGIIVSPHPDSEPLRFEFDHHLFVQDGIKTQFAPIEIHLKVTELFKSVEKLFKEITILDDSEFYQTGDEAQLEEYRNQFFDLLDTYLQDSEKYEGPIRCENGKIIDFIAKE